MAVLSSTIPAHEDLDDDQSHKDKGHDVGDPEFEFPAVCVAGCPSRR
jgi:hypothetical protein